MAEKEQPRQPTHRAYSVINECECMYRNTVTIFFPALFLVVVFSMSCGQASAQQAVQPAQIIIEEAVTITHNLRLGSQGEEVRTLQYKLQTGGYFPGDIIPTGYFGAITLKAVIAVQHAKGLPAFGFVGPLTRAALDEPVIPLVAIEPVSQAALRSNLLDALGTIEYCDSDYYPVSRAGGEEANSLHAFAQIQKNTGEFQVILQRTHLEGVTNFRADQKLAIYREHKKLEAISLEPSNNEQYKFAFNIDTGEPGFKGKKVYLLEGLIDGGTGAVTLSKKEPSYLNCPICLSRYTKIETGAGLVEVEDIKTGMMVWTVDARGVRILAPVIKTGHTSVPPTHQMVHLVLSDGRTLLASPGHPTADGRHVGDIRPGDSLDGSVLVSAERVPYQGNATYDILPEGSSGFYWADGILIGSTLR